ncbi:hypothetical protein ACSSS7_002835 [Eimeria intestinalis]
MPQLSETWQPVQLLQSVCSRASSVCVLHLRQPSSAGVEEPLQVLLSLHGESLCCSLLPSSAAAANAAASAAAAPKSPAAATAFPESSSGSLRPDYLQRPFWCPLKLTDEDIDEGVAAFAACELNPHDQDSGDGQEGRVGREAGASSGLVLMCGASGLMRLMLLRVQQPQQPRQQEDQQQQQRDTALQIIEGRLGGGAIPSSDSNNASEPWAHLQQLQKWKGTSTVARVATISDPYCSFTAGAPTGSPTATVAAASRLIAVGCVGGDLEVLLLQQQAAVPCCSLKHPAAVTTLKFHPSRALLAVGTAEGSLRVYDLSFAAAAAAAGAPAAAEHVPHLTLKDHLSSITALSFISAVSLTALQQHPNVRAGGAVKRKAAASLAAAEQLFPDGLVSAAGDSLVNVWDLSRLPASTGSLSLPQQQQHLQQQLQDAKKSALKLQKRLQEQQQKQQQQPLLQLPTLEIITSLLVDEDSAGLREAYSGRPFLLTGGADGLVKLWSLTEKKVLKVMPTAITVGKDFSMKGNNEEDLGAFIRSLLLLPARSNGDHSSSKRSLLVAQDSGLISLVSPVHSVSALAAVDEDGELLTPVKKATLKKKANRTESVCIVGSLEGVFASRFVPPPPEGCCCCCCQTRREGAPSGYPSSLLLLTGDPCAWSLELRSGSSGFTPLGGHERLGFAVVGKQQTPGHQAAVSCCDVSKNGCWVVTGGKDGSLCVWHRASDRLIARMQVAHASCLTAVAFQRQKWNNPSALVKTRPGLECRCDCRGIAPAQPHHLLFASCCDQNNVKLWRLPIPASLFNSDDVEETAKAAKVDVQHGLSFGKTEVIEEIECLASIVAHTKEINDLKFAPNDSVGFALRARIAPFSRASGRLEFDLGHKRGVHEIQFATRERTAATASGDATIKLWNLQTMTCIKTLQGDGFGFLCLRFLSLDSQIISFNANGEAQIWNCRTAECAVTTQPVHTDKVWSVDLWGEALASAGADGRICIWRDATAEAKAAMKLKAIREQQELAAAQTLEATGNTEEVVKLLLRLKKKYALGSFVQRQLLRSLSASLDASGPAALLRKGSLASLAKLLPDQQQRERLRQHLSPQQRQLLQQQQQEEGHWDEIITRLAEDDIKTLFGFVAEWAAADPVTAAAADGLLHLLLSRVPYELLFKSSHSRSSRDHSVEDRGVFGSRGEATVGGKPAKDVLKALVLNSQRHERRLIGLLQKSYLLDLLLPGAAAVQHGLQQLLRPLQQETGKRPGAAGDRKSSKKKRMMHEQQHQQQDEQQEFLLNSNILKPHFGSEFTEQCLYGDA